jgi:hypothetical protein
MPRPEESRACGPPKRMKNCFSAFVCPFLTETEVSSRPERSEMESRARGFDSFFVRCKQRCHPDRSEAQWRDLLFSIRNIESEWKRYPPLCHPDRSVAEWRDLQFNGPLMEMFHQF